MNLFLSTSFFAFSVFPSSYTSWDKIEIIGPFLVLFGIIWEFKELLSRLPDGATDTMRGAKHIREILAALIVVFGVAFELVVVPHTMKEVSDVKYATEVLRAKNDALELKMRPRRISMEQMANFIFLTEKIPKIPIVVSVFNGNPETETFAVDLRRMLSVAGFQTNSNPTLWGVEQHPDQRFHQPFDSTNALPWVAFIAYSTNGIIQAKIPKTETTNGFNRPIVISSRNEDIYYSIVLCLEQIGIKTEPSASMDIAPGECNLVVPDKSP